MLAEIDPSADVLWDAVAFTATTESVVDAQPRTDEEWQAVRLGAIRLIEASTLLSIKGRRVTTNRASAPGERSPAEVQRLMDTTHPRFIQFARALQAASVNALAAIDAKDPKALMSAGAVLDVTCDACHAAYWHTD